MTKHLITRKGKLVCDIEHHVFLTDIQITSVILSKGSKC